MMTEEVLRKELAELLRGGNSHEGFEVKVAGFPTGYINIVPKGVVRPPNVPFTPWDLLEHIRIAQWDILEFIRNPEHVSPVYPEGYWPDPGQEADVPLWEQTLGSFRADLDALVEIAENPECDLFSPIPHTPDYTVFRELLVIADHNSYHIGQFGIFRDILDAG